MEQGNLSERFLNDFKELEERIVILSGLKGNFVSFSSALDKVNYSHLNPVVSDDEIYQFLRSASDLRNILSHQNNVCYPSQDFYQRFHEIVKEICDPLTAYQISTKVGNIMCIQSGDNVLNVVDRMVSKHFSHVPLICNGVVNGVFSTTTFFQYLYANRKLKVDETYTIAEFLDSMDTSAHLNETYIFVGREEKAYSLLDYMVKKVPGAKRVSCIFVTEHGNKNEKLLGLITEADLLQLPIYERKMLRYQA